MEKRVCNYHIHTCEGWQIAVNGVCAYMLIALVLGPIHGGPN